MDLVLPNLVVIGAMKCGTSALHRMLAAHPAISMAAVKEANFFIGAERSSASRGTSWRDGQWCRGLEWYSSLFDPSFPVRGESSPGYTSPDHLQAAPRMRAVVPEARLVYLVRDPADRACSQFRHHVREKDELRPADEALLDPASQYVLRSRYHARLRPYLDRFPREQILVVVQERLREQPTEELSRILRHVGLGEAPVRTPPAPAVRSSPNGDCLPRRLREQFYEEVADDVARLRALIDDAIPEWGC